MRITKILTSSVGCTKSANHFLNCLVRLMNEATIIHRSAWTAWTRTTAPEWRPTFDAMRGLRRMRFPTISDALICTSLWKSLVESLKLSLIVASSTNDENAAEKKLSTRRNVTMNIILLSTRIKSRSAPSNASKIPTMQIRFHRIQVRCSPESTRKTWTIHSHMLRVVPELTRYNQS